MYLVFSHPLRNIHHFLPSAFKKFFHEESTRHSAFPNLNEELIEGVVARPPQGLWGTRELTIFIHGNKGTSQTFNGDQGNIRNCIREQGTF